MAKRSTVLIPILGLLLIITSLLPISHSDSIHDLLKRNGLPPGLLPKIVRSFNLDDNGLLEVNLYGPCLAKYENRVHFESVIRGNLSYGELTGLVGLSQEELFLWLPVKDIIVDDPSSGLILFDVGVVHKQFSLSLFDDPPNCKPDEEQSGLSFRSGGFEKGKGVEVM
ncbi:hypothetical protein Sjap_003448 [Stephania japonica]|uniref:Transmembrane protein n=1 Tax=Stephania japonica TaxID=461633 RepID=A0AAP0KNT4_9MAGN